MRHSPSGVEGEVDAFLISRFRELDLVPQIDASGNLLVKVPGSGGGRLAITAHKDEIGCMVTALEDGGRLRVRKLGGSYPWAYGEGVVDLLGDSACISGILSFGSRHVSHASPQHAQQAVAPLLWKDAWIETKLTASELADAGVRVGTRMVVGKHRKAALRIKDYVASYALDNKASVALLLELAERLESPRPDVYLVASSKEELGAIGALYFAQHNRMDALIALEVAPIAPEYSIQEGTAPVLLVEDAVCPYDEGLNDIVRRAAVRLDVPLQMAAVSNFGSDASIALKAGHVARAACLGFPTQNTHGYEIANLGAIEHCVELLDAVCHDSFQTDAVS